MAVRDLLVKIGFEADTSPLAGIESKLESIKSKLEVFATVSIVKKLYETAEGFAHWGEELHIAAENAGMTVEELQRLASAAGKSGVSMEMLTHSVALLSRRIYEAKNGSAEAQNAFAKAGFSMETINGLKNGQQALALLADKLQGIEDPMARMAIAQELVGRSGYRMVGFLAQGSAAIKAHGDSAQKLGLILSGPQVHALVESEHAFQRLHAIIKSLGAFVSSTIGPVFTYAIGQFSKWFGVNKAIIGINIKNWINDVASGMGFISGVCIVVFRNFKRFFDLFGFSSERILPFTMRLGGAALTLITLAMALKTVKFILEPLNILFKVILGPMKLLGMAALWLGKQFLALIPILRMVYATVAQAVGPFLSIVAAIGLMVVAIHDLYAVFSGHPEESWVNQFVSKIGWLNTSVDFVVKAIAEAWVWLSDTLGTIFSGLSTGTGGFIDALKGLSNLNFADLGKFFASLGGDLLGKIIGIGQAFGTWLVGLEPVKAMLEYLNSAWDKAASGIQIIKGIFGISEPALLGAGGGAGGFLSNAWNSVKSGGSNLLNSASQAIGLSATPGAGVAPSSNNQAVDNSQTVYNVNTTVPPSNLSPQQIAAWNVQKLKEAKAAADQLKRQTNNSIPQGVAG